MIVWSVPDAAKVRISDNFPYVLRFKEKHGDRIFLITNEDDLKAAALKVLTDRFLDGYWYIEPEAPSSPHYTRDEAGQLLGPARAAALREVDAYERAVVCYEDDLRRFEFIKRAVESKDGKAAFCALLDRIHYEYESFDRLYPESVRPEDN